MFSDIPDTIFGNHIDKQVSFEWWRTMPLIYIFFCYFVKLIVPLLNKMRWEVMDIHYLLTECIKNNLKLCKAQ